MLCMQLAQVLEIGLLFCLSLGAFVMCLTPDLLDRQLSVSPFYGTPVMPRRVHLACPCALVTVSQPTNPSATVRISPLAARGSHIAPTANFLTLPFDWMGDSRTASNPSSEGPYGIGDILRLGVSVLSLEGLKKIPIIHTQSINSPAAPPTFPSGPPVNQSTKVLSRVKQDPHCLSLILMSLLTRRR